MEKRDRAKEKAWAGRKGFVTQACLCTEESAFHRVEALRLLILSLHMVMTAGAGSQYTLPARF